MTDEHLTGHQPDGPAGVWRAQQPAPVCRCGQPVQQPWQTRDALYSPASFIGGLLWYAVLAGLLLCELYLASWILLGLLTAVIAGSLALQAIRRHHRLCWLTRGLWFGVALPGVPWRALSWFSGW